MIRLIIAMLSLAVSLPVSAAVWRAENRWSETWEQQYAEWIAAKVTPDFMVPVDLKVDCADLCYVVRAVFSCQNALPFLAHNYQGEAISHELSAFDHLPTHPTWHNDQRFRAFLKRLINHVGTASLRFDTYPVALTDDTVRPGLLIYENLIAKHACFIGRIDPDRIIPITFFESTVPPLLRFNQSTTLNVNIYDANVPQHRSGIVRWNWPVYQNGNWRHTPDEQMPHFSRQIYQPNFPHRKTLSRPLNRIAKKRQNPEALQPQPAIAELVEHFRQQVEFRAELILEAWQQLQKNPDIKSEAFAFDYSTHSRDQRLQELIGQIWYALVEYDLPRNAFFNALKQQTLRISYQHPPVTLLHLFICSHQDWISPSAYQSPLKRWGLHWDEEDRQWILGGKHPYESAESWYIDSADTREVFEKSLLSSRQN